MTDEEHKLIESEIDDLDTTEEPDDPEEACVVCLTIWPADALEMGECPDCVADMKDAAA